VAEVTETHLTTEFGRNGGWRPYPRRLIEEGCTVGLRAGAFTMDVLREAGLTKRAETSLTYLLAVLEASVRLSSLSDPR
jgi:hypothetical protein